MNQHIPVLLPAVVEALNPGDSKVSRLIDGTVGAGGHSLALLRAGIDKSLAFDLDSNAIGVAQETLADYSDRVSFHHGSYLNMGAVALERGWTSVDAILLDLGLSSLQLDDPERGFAFRYDAPLDMRFDAEAGGDSARDLVNELPTEDLADLLFRFGEERHSRRIARAIVKNRPIETTRQLAHLVARAKPSASKGARKTHPATKAFQALRIAVNGELDAVEQVLPIAVDLLRPGGRLAVITFHSLEDRIVKRSFKQMSLRVKAPPGMASIGDKRALVKLVNRKPIVADAAEISANPRGRSAKLRVVEKLEWA